MNEHTAVLEVDRLTKRYGLRKPAVDDLSFTVRQGEICGFLGPNGAGKTTTLRTILGVIQPDQGGVRLFGRPVTPRALDRVGFLPEERGLYRKMTAENVIVFFGRMKGLATREARRRARALLEEHGLGAAARKKVKELSKGMAQKVQILSCLVHEPEFVILDEPFSGLDPVNQKSLEEMVRGLRDRGATVVFSTHVMEHAERLCDGIVLLANGRKVFDGTVAEALETVPRQVAVDTQPGFDLAAALASDARFAVTREPDADGRARWRVNLENGASAQELLAACVAAGAPLDLFEPTRPHLHDAFVALVQGDPDPSASAGAP